MTAGQSSDEIRMETDAEKMERFKTYQAEMRDCVGIFNSISCLYGTRPSAEARWILDETAKKLKRITGEWHDLSLHLTGIDNDIFKALLNEVNDVLLFNGYGPKDDVADNDSNCSERNDGNMDMINADKSNSNGYKNCDWSSNARDGVNFNVVFDKVNDK
ncbi:hypothetical protein AVEN_104564-1, partial [Araneus ventricosus]